MKSSVTQEEIKLPDCLLPFLSPAVEASVCNVLFVSLTDIVLGHFICEGKGEWKSGLYVSPTSLLLSVRWRSSFSGLLIT